MKTDQIHPQDKLHGFRVDRVEDIPELRSTAVIATHEATGARLLHLVNEDPNNLFSMAFRTPASDNTGVPHILEHSVLCGSNKFPVKDPFQELLKGSLQTFLNAMTYPDKTVYPVSSQVEADFFNLVDVYCDAVLNPLLTRNTLCQEGWRFDVPDPYGPVNIKGIVYNEMKGVFSDFASHVARKTMSGLFPDTTYFYESGGEPAHITDLTYDDFKAFHAKYYHPSNSFIFLYGNIPTGRTIRFLQENYLGNFKMLQAASEITRQPIWDKPRTMELSAPAPKEDDGTATIIISWVLGSSADPVAALSGRILSRYLLGMDSSPLKRALIDSGLGEDLDDMCGFDPELIQSTFAAGLRKAKPEHAEKVKSLIFDTLNREVEKGLDEEVLEGAVRRTEFKLREITGGGHFPYNLMLAERCYQSWIYGGDPLAHLKFEGPLKFIKSEKAKGQEFFKAQIKNLLLDNPHHLLSVVKASSKMARKLEQQTKDQAREISVDFGQKEKRKYHKLTLNLLEEQKKVPSVEDMAKLPRLNRSDLPTKGIDTPTDRTTIRGVEVVSHPLFTAGIVYLDVGFDCLSIPREFIPWLPLYSGLLTRCGARGISYEEMSKRTALATGGLSSSIICHTKAGAPSDLLFQFALRGRALPERFGDMLGIFSDLLLEPDLANAKQLKDLVLKMRNDMNASVIGAGHAYAMGHAASCLTLSKKIQEETSGIAQLRFLDSLIREGDMAKVADKMRGIHSLLVNRRQATLSLTADNPNDFMGPLDPFLGTISDKETTPRELSFTPSAGRPDLGIEISASVNYVARAWRLNQAGPREMGQLLLLSRNLSTGYLWDKVRVEGGAYGGMAVARSVHPVFMCGSYRDPNLGRTLDHFEKGIKDVAKGLSSDKIDQSVIGTIGMIDKPMIPMTQGFGETLALMSGRTREFRQELRESVLNATPDTLKEAARMLLDIKETAVTVLGSASALDNAEKEGNRFEREALIA